MTVNLRLLTENAEWLSMTEDPGSLTLANTLFDSVLDLFHYTYFNPGEPEAECLFCGRNRALPGCDDVLTSEEEESGKDLDCEVYWTRVWATRALDILDPHYSEEPCCKERKQLWADLEV